jgi:hypothetical protein
MNRAQRLDGKSPKGRRTGGFSCSLSHERYMRRLMPQTGQIVILNRTNSSLLRPWVTQYLP